MGYSPWGRKESDTTKGLNNSRASQSVLTGLTQGRVDDSDPLQPSGPPGGTRVGQTSRVNAACLPLAPAWPPAAIPPWVTVSVRRYLSLQGGGTP